MFLSILVAAIWYREKQRTEYIAQRIGEPRAFEPLTLAKLRDVNYPFTIEIYGYKYQGNTGNYIDEYILTYGAYEKNMLVFMRDLLDALETILMPSLLTWALTPDNTPFLGHATSSRSTHSNRSSRWPIVFAR